MNMSAVEGRAEFAAYLRKVLVGPMQGPEEIIQGTPLLRYMMGMLFPKDGERDLAEDGTAEGRAQSDKDAEESVAASRRPMPSSVGISFLVPKDAVLACKVAGAVYERDGGASGRRRSEGVWRRRSIPGEGHELVKVRVAGAVAPIEVLDGRAILHTHVREWRGGNRLVTITLVNALESKGGINPAELLFQVQLSVEGLNRRILTYPQPPSTAASDQEEAEVRYLYRGSPVYARGHGAAAMWDTGQSECSRVWVDFMPSAEVRSATFEIRAEEGLDSRYRELDFLAFSEDPTEVRTVLGGLAAAFKTWIDNEEELARDAEESIGIALARRCRDWHRRMEEGIECLSDPTVFRAFQLANQAMLWQMEMAGQGREGPFEPDKCMRVPELLAGAGHKWRPFQVAFILGSINALVSGDGSADRDVVDVIWFPTGGGKTEAYLLVAAFELIRRRLMNGGEDPATGVLSRYTLRMLTTQQFQRTGMLVCALELMRRKEPHDLGTRPFSAGLWVGQALTPNRFRKAEEEFEKWDLADRNAKNPFLVDRCPACGTAIVDHGQRVAGVDCRPNSFGFRCLSQACEFRKGLPLQVVDEALYREPPSILLGTLDKFAMLAWDNAPSAFFGDGSQGSMPPSIIIQDELHLISGPLGSLSAPYEVAIDGIIRARSGGVGPKVIASTATIRNSREQVRGLYGRKSIVFPSPVRTWEEAFFFSLEDTRDKPGRLYIGAMGQGTTTPVVSMVWATAALLQASAEVDLPPGLKDSYWTVLVYLNSIRELGRTITAASQEIPDRMKAIALAEDNVREVGEVMELSAKMAKDMGEAIRGLQRKGTAKTPPVGLVPCTNIISVGVDVDRLGVMMVNGQPKLTSEYIQASSRVGRSSNAPGVVLALYSPAKPRDRSHYEDFLAYHEAVYRYVEPTSVTPYAPPARERTLHAALIALVRHGTGYGANDAARLVDFDEPEVAELVAMFRRTVEAADPGEADEANRYIDEFLRLWAGQVEAGSNLTYVSPGLQFPTGLIRDYGAPERLGYRQAMRSVRSVDPDVQLMPVDEG